MQFFLSRLYAKARLFADNTSLSYSGRNYDIMKSDINNDLSKLNQWEKLWLVDFNPKTTKALVISTNAKPYQMPLIYHKI
jgi:hypothetical protein